MNRLSGFSYDQSVISALWKCLRRHSSPAPNLRAFYVHSSAVRSAIPPSVSLYFSPSSHRQRSIFVSVSCRSLFPPNAPSITLSFRLPPNISPISLHPHLSPLTLSLQSVCLPPSQGDKVPLIKGTFLIMIHLNAGWNYLGGWPRRTVAVRTHVDSISSLSSSSSSQIKHFYCFSVS